MSATSLSLIILLLVLAIGKVAPCDTRGMTDGCSIPDYLPPLYEDLFTPACDRHDVCYACGQKFGVTRDKCDTMFYNNLLARCNTVTFWTRAVCRSAAKVYYLAVKEYGEDHYEDPSLSWCNAIWVQNCL